MRYIAVVGSFLIFIVTVLSGLMYYFIQDECLVGRFSLRRDNATCLAQKNCCCKQGSIDCPDDENILSCVDLYGSWEWYTNERKTGPNLICDESHCAMNCTCKECLVLCSAYTEIPQTLSSNVTTISFEESSLGSLDKNSLARYKEIRSLYLSNNNLMRIEKGAFENQANLDWLVISDNRLREICVEEFQGLFSLEIFLASNNLIRVADFADFENSSTLEWIDLSKNLLTTDNLRLPFLPALKELVLSNNNLDKITDLTFSQLPILRALYLEGNRIAVIHSNAFLHLSLLTDLNLANNNIALLPQDLFQPVKNITKLSIGFNPIRDFTVAILTPLRNLQSLAMEEIDMDNVEKDAFYSLKKLDFVYFKKFHYCMTYTPKVENCWPASDGVSSLSDLLKKPLLRAAVWSISVVTCLGNALVLWGRFTAKDENRVLSIVIRNLAVSDMLMGLYLLIIALEDVRFRDNYNHEASVWMTSWSCTLVGILAMTSSEVSVMILTFMSIERFMLIAAPLSRHRVLTQQAAFSSIIAIWIIGIILALVPAIHWRNSTRYYGVNGMCFPLHIDDPFLIGWEYSAFVFLGLNLFGLIVIGYVYAAMFASIWRTRKSTPLLSHRDSEFALRFFLIVLTDAACWAPIITLKILALMKHSVDPDLHAWLVVFILPVNSAINPLLYTFTTPKFRERLRIGWLLRMQSYVTRRQSSQELQVTSSEPDKDVVLSETNKFPNDAWISPIIFIDNYNL